MVGRRGGEMVGRNGWEKWLGEMVGRNGWDKWLGEVVGRSGDEEKWL